MSFYVTVVLKTWLCWTSNIAGFYYRQKDTTGTSLVAQWLRIRRGWVLWLDRSLDLSLAGADF